MKVYAVDSNTAVKNSKFDAKWDSVQFWGREIGEFICLIVKLIMIILTL